MYDDELRHHGQQYERIRDLQDTVRKAGESLQIDHTLPQSAGPGWTSKKKTKRSANDPPAPWPDAENRDFWVHRISNLALYTKTQNLNAGKREWKYKRKIYMGIGIDKDKTDYKRKGIVTFYSTERLCTGKIARADASCTLY